MDCDRKIPSLKETLSDEFFVEIVERKLKTSRTKFGCKILSIESATKTKENFASSLYRAKLKVEMIETREEIFINVIIKVMSPDSDLVVNYGLFGREVLMYDELIKSFERIWHEATGDEINFGPKVLKVAFEPFCILVLDDLCSEGFKMIDRKVGANMSQAMLVLSKLAKFHAASAKQLEKEEFFTNEQLDRKLILKLTKSSKISTQRATSYKTILKLLIEAANSCGFKDIAEKMSRWDFLKVLTSFLSVGEAMSSGFQVLNHGDAWCNNFMFKGDFGVRFIDFQLSHWGSPCGDLRYFLITSLADDIKVEHFDDLILFYHEELVENLKVLNYANRIPTLAELHIDMLEKGTGLAFCLMFVLFLAKIDSDADIDIQTLLDPNKFSEADLRSAFMSEANIKALKTWLPFLNKRGFLDALLSEAPCSTLVTELLKKIKLAQMEESQEASKVEETKIENHQEFEKMRKI